MISAAELLKDAVYDEELGVIYDPNTGQLWKLKELVTSKYKISGERERQSTCPVGFGTGPNNFYKQSTHVIWHVMTGNWPRPGYLIDHKDRNVANMKWDNLREATPTQNNVNRSLLGRWAEGTDQLVTGVVREKNRYVVWFGGNKTRTRYGSFATAEEANTFAIAKRRELYGDFVPDEEQ